MPQASNEDRARWGGANGVGEDKAENYLRERGWTLTRGSEWIKPSPDHEVTEDELGALYFLVEEWDYGGIVLSGTPAPGWEKKNV